MYNARMDPNPVFKLAISCHDQWCIEKIDASKKEHAFIQSVMRMKYIHHPFYVNRQPVCAFFQGGSHLEEGWYLIEFWNPCLEDCQKFVEFLNDEYQKWTYEE